MNNKVLLLSAAALVCCFASPGAWAVTCPTSPYEGRECQPTQDNCMSEPTTTIMVELGGEGSVGTEDECQSSPAKDADGNIVEADVLMTWTRMGPTAGTLTILATNVTCAPFPATETDTDITAIWFNTPDEISGCVLKEATIDGVNHCGGIDCTTPSMEQKVWTLGTDNGSGCLGDFDHQLGTNGIQASIKDGKNGEFVLECTGSGLDTLTACDIATDPSDAEVGERLANLAMHFQNTDVDNILSNKVASNCHEQLFVELGSFSATPSDGRVELDWATLLEIDNVGFHIFRRDLHTGVVKRLTEALIPAMGDIFQGGQYRFVDESAVNGVLYEYFILDIDLSGQRAQHPGILSVANPRNPRVRLLTPNYGSSHLRANDRPTFTWESSSRRNGRLLVSADPTFQNDAVTMEIQVAPGRDGKGSITLNPGQARRMEKLAFGNGGLVYWNISEKTLGSVVHRSATYNVIYGVVSE